MPPYPAGSAARDRFVLDRRPPRSPHDPWKAQGLLVEEERSAAGSIARVATVFLTGRECPWRCVMCDLWRHTTTLDTPAGAIAAQVAAARRALDQAHESASQMKLYNAGSFFDPRAVPEQDYDAIAAKLTGLSRVVVESHPALVGSRTAGFLEALTRAHTPEVPPPALEVAIGLETAHPDALDRLNKRMTVDDVAGAADRLRRLGVGLRVFLLISPPFVPDSVQDEWLVRSIDAALDCGATAISLIPTRTGNGALEALVADGWLRPPRLADIERSLAVALAHARTATTHARVFADLWDLDRFADCPHCLDARRVRLRSMNLDQRFVPQASCPHCGTASS